jgi:hypothetical protein
MTTHTENGIRTAAAGLDETRRLLYLALMREHTEKYVLAGTLVNALAHHHPDGTLNAGEIADRVIAAIEHPDDASRAYLLEQIGRLTAELETPGKR